MCYLGVRRLAKKLTEEELIAVGRKLVKRYMAEMGIYCVYPKPNLSKNGKEHKCFPYLLRNMSIFLPNQVWAMDITYIPMARGFIYLAAVLDWFTRRDLFDRPDALRLLPAQLDPEALCVLGEEFLRVYDKKLGTLRYAVETPARTLAAAVVGAGPARTLVIAGAREIRGAPFHRGEPERFRLTLAAPDEPESFLQDVHFGPHTFTTLAGTALRAFDAAGTQLWECTLPSRARAPLCACGNALAAFAASGGAIWIIDADTGRLSAQLSSETADKRVSAPPIPAGPGEALAIYGRELCLVDTTAAAVRWRRRLDDVAPAEARFFPDSPETLFVWGRTPAQGWRLEIIDRAHGGTRWHRDFPGDAPILDVVPSRDDAVVLCLSLIHISEPTRPH